MLPFHAINEASTAAIVEEAGEVTELMDKERDSVNTEVCRDKVSNDGAATGSDEAYDCKVNRAKRALSMIFWLKM
jgi:hypothetical protein